MKGTDTRIFHDFFNLRPHTMFSARLKATSVTQNFAIDAKIANTQ